MEIRLGLIILALVFVVIGTFPKGKIKTHAGVIILALVFMVFGILGGIMLITNVSYNEFPIMIVSFLYMLFLPVAIGLLQRNETARKFSIFLSIAAVPLYRILWLCIKPDGRIREYQQAYQQTIAYKINKAENLIAFCVWILFFTCIIYFLTRPKVKEQFK